MNGRRVHLVDTPGFDDTNVQDADILRVITMYLNTRQNQKVRLSGIIYLHRISDRRVTGTASHNIRMFRGLVGEQTMRNVVLVTTMWDEVSPEEGAEREAELLGTDEFWGLMLDAGARFERYYHPIPDDGQRIVYSLLQNHPRTIQLQEEMAQGTTLEDTTAGRQVADQVRRMEEEHRREVDRLRTQMEDTNRQHNEAALARLREQHERAMRLQSEAAKAYADLQDDTIRELQWQLSELRAARSSRSSCVIL